MYSKMFAERLKVARKEMGYTQEEIAEQLKVRSSTYGRYEVGLREPNIDTMAEIAIILNVKIDWLFGLTKDGGPIDHAKKIQKQREIKRIFKKIDREAELELKLTMNEKGFKWKLDDVQDV